MHYIVIDVKLKKNFFFSELTNDAFEPPNYKTHFNFTLVCLWNVQIQILKQPKWPS